MSQVLFLFINLYLIMSILQG